MRGTVRRMDFAFSPTAEALRTELLDFMDTHVYPAEAVHHQQIVDSGDPHTHPPIMEELKVEARKRGLWNLFLPHKTKWTEGLSNLDYAPLAEIMGRSHIASQACNCSAPDTGNMEVLTMFGTPEQQEEWLYPLLEGEIRSAFAMTEPAVASSDASNIECRIERDGDEYVINGRKWWISGAIRPECKAGPVVSVRGDGGSSVVVSWLASKRKRNTIGSRKTETCFRVPSTECGRCSSTRSSSNRI